MTTHTPQPRGHRLKLGLTGGIGSGKSTVAGLLSDLGAFVLDADALSRASTAPGGSAMAAITRTFGASYVAADGGMDRERMRALVFSDPTARQRLEAIVHPCVARDMQHQLEHNHSRCVVFDVPLLVESDRWRQQLHAVVVVDCDSPTQVQRVVARSHWTADAVEQVIAAQASRAQRAAAADAVLFNGAGTTLAQLHTEVQALALSFGIS